MKIFEEPSYEKSCITTIATLTSTLPCCDRQGCKKKCCPLDPSPLPKVRANLKVRMHPRCFQKLVSFFSQFSEKHVFSFFLPFFFGGNKKKEFINSARIYSCVTSLENNVYCADVGRKRKTRHGNHFQLCSAGKILTTDSLNINTDNLSIGK